MVLKIKPNVINIFDKSNNAGQGFGKSAVVQEVTQTAAPTLLKGPSDNLRYEHGVATLGTGSFGPGDSAGATCSFVTAFPNTTYTAIAVYATADGSSNINDHVWFKVFNKNTTFFQLMAYNTGTTTISNIRANWMAIGT